MLWVKNVNGDYIFIYSDRKPGLHDTRFQVIQFVQCGIWLLRYRHCCWGGGGWMLFLIFLEKVLIYGESGYLLPVLVSGKCEQLVL